MKSFLRKGPPPSTSPGERVKPNVSIGHVQAAPVEFDLGEGRSGSVKVDVAVTTAGQVMIAGWRLGEVDLAIRICGSFVETSESSFARADVVEHFGLSTGIRPGFVLVGAGTDQGPVELGCAPRGTNDWTFCPVVLADAGQLTEADAVMLGPARALLARSFTRFSRDWMRAVAVASPQGGRTTAAGHLEGAALAVGTSHVVVCGWVAVESGGEMWLEDDLGNGHPLDGASWRMRHDVYRAVGPELGSGAIEAGFVIHLQAAPGVTCFRLKALTTKGVHLLSEVHCNGISSDPVEFSRWLFGIVIPDAHLAPHTAAVDGPLLEGLITRTRAQQEALPVSTRQLGTSPESPLVSVVIPLFGRTDFVESQMLEWARDPWVRAHAELIYVVDDPALADSFRREAEELYRLYGIPFRWVWGGVNRGYSAANNLGVTHATGEYLLFLNSDAFPQQPGWLQALTDVLVDRPDVGAVAPRLVFAEGGIQHAGMAFQWHSDYDVWINRHPHMGMDTALDPARGVTSVPAVTGACLLLRRRDFDAVGGWDTGYLIGDFEDSDLCLKLREAGLDIVYVPDIQLTHLERQSMTAIGSGDYRMRVTLWNALRHQRRWEHLIKGLEHA